MIIANKTNNKTFSIWWLLNGWVQIWWASFGLKDFSSEILKLTKQWVKKMGGRDVGGRMREMFPRQVVHIWMSRKTPTLNHCHIRLAGGAGTVTQPFTRLHLHHCTTTQDRHRWPSGDLPLSLNSSRYLSTYSIWLVINNIYQNFLARMMKLTRKTSKRCSFWLARWMFFLFADHLRSHVLTSHEWLPVRIPHGPRAEMCPACWYQAVWSRCCTPELREILHLGAMALSLLVHRNDSVYLLFVSNHP